MPHLFYDNLELRVINMINEYIDLLTTRAVAMIANAISHRTFDSIIKNDLRYHFEDPGSRSFQDYYFKIIGDTNNFLNDPQFFRHFKGRYAIQGADVNYLDKLEANKKLILHYIESDYLAKLYFEFFSKVECQFGPGSINKEFGSFFTKVVHTFKPNSYCALDMQIKNYFGLEKDSYLISLIVISKAYRNWSSNNLKLVSSLKDSIKEYDTYNVIKQEKLSDLKLLDLIFWYN